MTGTALQRSDEEDAMEGVISRSLVRSAPVELSSPSEIAAAIAERDDDQILRTMAGEVITEFFYCFSIAGKQVEGISVTGANEFARIRADAGFPIRFPPGSLDIQEVTQNDQRGLRVVATARDCRTGADGIGMCFQPWEQERKIRDKQGRVTGTEMVENNHADRKALSIAKRNAILSLLPEAQILVILRERKKLIAQNERDNKGLLGAGPKQTTAPIRQDDDPYKAAPKPAEPEPASEEQIARLLELADHPRIIGDVKEKVERKLRAGMTAKMADTWIASLEVGINGPPGADPSTGELGLGDARKTTNAVRSGR